MSEQNDLSNLASPNESSNQNAQSSWINSILDHSISATPPLESTNTPTAKFDIIFQERLHGRRMSSLDDDDDDEDQEYISESLGAFLAAAKQTLAQTQKEFLEITPRSVKPESATLHPNEDGICIDTNSVDDPPVLLEEDENDIKLRREILQIFEKKDASENSRLLPEDEMERIDFDDKANELLPRKLCEGLSADSEIKNDVSPLLYPTPREAYLEVRSSNEHGTPTINNKCRNDGISSQSNVYLQSGTNLNFESYDVCPVPIPDPSDGSYDPVAWLDEPIDESHISNLDPPGETSHTSNDTYIRNTVSVSTNAPYDELRKSKEDVDKFPSSIPQSSSLEINSKVMQHNQDVCTTKTGHPLPEASQLQHNMGQHDIISFSSEGKEIALLDSFTKKLLIEGNVKGFKSFQLSSTPEKLLANDVGTLTSNSTFATKSRIAQFLASPRSPGTAKASNAKRQTPESASSSGGQCSGAKVSESQYDTPRRSVLQIQKSSPSVMLGLKLVKNVSHPNENQAQESIEESKEKFLGNKISIHQSGEGTIKSSATNGSPLRTAQTPTPSSSKRPWTQVSPTFLSSTRSSLSSNYRLRVSKNCLSSNVSSPKASRFTSASAERLSKPKQSSMVYKSINSQPNARFNSPTQTTKSILRNKITAVFTAESADRLSKPRQVSYFQSGTKVSPLKCSLRPDSFTLERKASSRTPAKNFQPIKVKATSEPSKISRHFRSENSQDPLNHPKKTPIFTKSIISDCHEKSTISMSSSQGMKLDYVSTKKKPLEPVGSIAQIIDDVVPKTVDDTWLKPDGIVPFISTESPVKELTEGMSPSPLSMSSATAERSCAISASQCHSKTKSIIKNQSTLKIDESNGRVNLLDKYSSNGKMKASTTVRIDPESNKVTTINIDTVGARASASIRNVENNVERSDETTDVSYQKGISAHHQSIHAKIDSCVGVIEQAEIRVPDPPACGLIVADIHSRPLPHLTQKKRVMLKGTVKTRNQIAAVKATSLSGSVSSNQLNRKNENQMSSLNGKVKENLSSVDRLKSNKVDSISTVDIPRGDVIKKSTIGINTGRRRVTIPKAPKFATDARLGPRGIKAVTTKESHLSSESFEKNLRHDDTSVGSCSTARKVLTVPLSPNFTSLSKNKDKSGIIKEDVIQLTLAQSSDFLQKGLRDTYRPPKVQRKGPTIPLPPKFQTIPQRQLPKSSEEKDLEEMERYRANPFKAKLTSYTKSIDPRIIVENNSNLKKRAVTMPQPFNLRYEDKKQDPKVSVKPQANKESEESHFQAKPMPSFSHTKKGMAGVPRVISRPVTTPSPFTLSSNNSKPLRNPPDLITREVHGQTPSNGKMLKNTIGQPFRTGTSHLTDVVTPTAESVANPSTKKSYTFTFQADQRNGLSAEKLKQKVALHEEKTRKPLFKAIPMPSTTYSPNLILPHRT